MYNLYCNLVIEPNIICLVILSSNLILMICPLTQRVIGAPPMISQSQPAASISVCLPQPSDTDTQAVVICRAA